LKVLNLVGTSYENYDPYSSAPQILLKCKTLIYSNEGLKSGFAHPSQKLSVFNPMPTHLCDGID